MAVGISKKKTIFFSLTEHCTHKTRLASSEGGGERGRFLLPPSLKSLLDHGLLDSIFGKQTNAYSVAVKWNFESGHYKLMNLSSPYAFFRYFLLKNYIKKFAIKPIYIAHKKIQINLST
jgi:hypothetical protein